MKPSYKDLLRIVESLAHESASTGSAREDAAQLNILRAKARATLDAPAPGDSTKVRGDVLPSRADELADTLRGDAFSGPRYDAHEWRAIARLLARQGYNERAIEAVLRSKHMRWAADAYDATKAGFIKYWRYSFKTSDAGDAQVRALVEETFARGN